MVNQYLTDGFTRQKCRVFCFIFVMVIYNFGLLFFVVLKNCFAALQLKMLLMLCSYYKC